MHAWAPPPWRSTLVAGYHPSPWRGAARRRLETKAGALEREAGALGRRESVLGRRLEEDGTERALTLTFTRTLTLTRTYTLPLNPSKVWNVRWSVG